MDFEAAIFLKHVVILKYEPIGTLKGGSVIKFDEPIRSIRNELIFTIMCQ